MLQLLAEFWIGYHARFPTLVEQVFRASTLSNLKKQCCFFSPADPWYQLCMSEDVELSLIRPPASRLPYLATESELHRIIANNPDFPILDFVREVKRYNFTNPHVIPRNVADLVLKNMPVRPDLLYRKYYPGRCFLTDLTFLPGADLEEELGPLTGTKSYNPGHCMERFYILSHYLHSDDSGDIGILTTENSRPHIEYSSGLCNHQIRFSWGSYRPLLLEDGPYPAEMYPRVISHSVLRRKTFYFHNYQSPTHYLKPAIIAGLKVHLDSQGWKVDWQSCKPCRGGTTNKEWAIAQHVIVRVHQHFQHPHPNLHKNSKYESYAQHAVETIPSIIESMNRHAVCEVELGYFQKTVEEVVEYQQVEKRVEVQNVKEYDLGFDEKRLSQLVMAAMEWRRGHKATKRIVRKTDPLLKKYGVFTESMGCKSKGQLRKFVGEKNIQLTEEELTQAWFEILELCHPDNKRNRRAQLVEVTEEIYTDEEDLIKLSRRMKDVGLSEEDIHKCRRNFGLKVVGTKYQHTTSEMKTVTVDVKSVRQVEKTTFVQPTPGEPRTLDFSKEVMRQLNSKRNTPLKRYLTLEAGRLSKKYAADPSDIRGWRKARKAAGKLCGLVDAAKCVTVLRGHLDYLQVRAKTAFGVKLYVPKNQEVFNGAKLEYLSQLLCWKSDTTAPLKHRKFKSPRDRWWKICHGHS